MRFWLKMTILGAAMATAAWGSACGTASYATYAGMSGGCTVGDETFSNFSALSISGTVGLTLPEADILITPEVAGGVDELVFSYQSLPSSNPNTQHGGGAMPPAATRRVTQYESGPGRAPDPAAARRREMSTNAPSYNAAFAAPWTRESLYRPIRDCGNARLPKHIFQVAESDASSKGKGFRSAAANAAVPPRKTAGPGSDIPAAIWNRPRASPARH